MVDQAVRLVRRNDGQVGVGQAYLTAGDDAVPQAEVNALVANLNALGDDYTYTAVGSSTTQTASYATYGDLLGALPLSVTPGGALSAWTEPAADTRAIRRASLYAYALEFLAGYNPSMTNSSRNTELTIMVQKYLSACAEDANIDSDSRYGILEETFKEVTYHELYAGLASSSDPKVDWSLSADSSVYQTPARSGNNWVPVNRSTVTFSTGFATSGNANFIDIWAVLR